MIKNWQTKVFKGFVYIDYRDNGSVKKAITKYHGKNFKGRNLICDAVTTGMKKGFKRDFKPENNDEENQVHNQQEHAEENDE